MYKALLAISSVQLCKHCQHRVVNGPTRSGLNPARTKNASPNPARTRRRFKIVNEPEKVRTIVYKFLFNLMQNFVQFYLRYFTVYSCATLS